MRGIVAYEIEICIRFCRTKLSLLYFLKSSELTNLHILVTIFENLLAETQTQGRVNSVFPATYMMQIENDYIQVEEKGKSETHNLCFWEQSFVEKTFFGQRQ